MKPARVRRVLRQPLPAGAVWVGAPSRWMLGRITSFFASELELRGYRASLGRAVMRGQVDLGELRGRDLACWCPPGEPCHADLLLDLANRDLSSRARA